MRVKALLLVSALAALPLTTSCSADSPVPPGAAAAADRDACLIGTWKVDVTDMARQAAAQINSGATGTGSGTTTLIFGDHMAINYDAVADINGTVSGQTMILKITFTGDASSTDWAAKDGNLTGTMAASAVSAKTEGTLDGEPVPVTVKPFDGALDLAPGNLGYTCSGNTATLTTPKLTWRLTKA
jgi:hypothetical protein